MKTVGVNRFIFLVVLSLLTSMANAAQELSPELTGSITLGERTIPAPVGLSPQMLEEVKARQFNPVIPVPKSSAGWLELQKSFDAPVGELGRQAAKHNGATYEVQEIAGVRTYMVTPRAINKRFAGRVFVHAHGGAFVFGGGDAALLEAVWLATAVGVKVMSVDYRRPPLHPFPAAIDDILAVWRKVMEDQDSAQTALFGISAGGNLALAVTLKLKQLGEPLPGAVFAGTPATDLENVSDTWYTLAGLDPLGYREGVIEASFDLYRGEADLAIPFISPVNGDLEGFPPTILISGTRDLLLSDTVRMHRALRGAGVDADLHIYDGQTHGDFMRNLFREVPESKDAQRELSAFFEKYLN